MGRELPQFIDSKGLAHGNLQSIVSCVFGDGCSTTDIQLLTPNVQETKSKQHDALLDSVVSER